MGANFTSEEAQALYEAAVQQRAGEQGYSADGSGGLLNARMSVLGEAGGAQPGSLAASAARPSCLCCSSGLFGHRCLPPPRTT